MTGFLLFGKKKEQDDKMAVPRTIRAMLGDEKINMVNSILSPDVVFVSPDRKKLSPDVAFRFSREFERSVGRYFPNGWRANGHAENEVGKRRREGDFFPVEITQTTYIQRNVLMPGKDRLET